MLVRDPILELPVHKRSRQRYYRDHDREVERRKPAVEEEWGRPFAEIPAPIQIHWKDRWYWPPWFLNDVVGHLRIGGDGEGSLAGDLYLKRRHFPHSAPERLYRDRETAREREQVLFRASSARHPVTAGDNASYLAAVREILKEARALLRRHGRGTAGARIWLPGFGLGCVDLAAADRQLREREQRERRAN